MSDRFESPSMESLETACPVQDVHECAALGRPLSRRVFLSATAVVGALTFLGQAFGGRLQAYADEDGNTHFVIYVLSKEQVPVMAVDVSKPNTTDPTKPAYPGVQGVSVTIHSNTVPDKDQTVTTGEDGFVPVNVRAQSLQRDDDTASTYYFYGSIRAYAPGWRSFHEEVTLIEAGTPADKDGNRTNTVVVPTQPDDGKTPYLQGLMLDGADLQYRSGQVARVWQDNAFESTFTFEVVTQSAGAKATCGVFVKKKDASSYQELTGTKSATSDATGLATVTFTGKWLSLIEAGSVIKATFQVNSGTTYELELTEDRLAFEAPIGAFVDNPMMENVNVSIGQQPDESAPWCPMPEWLVREKDSFLAAFPFMPISFFADISGNFGISATLFEVNFLKRVNGEDKLAGKDRFSAFGGKTWSKGWENWGNATLDAIEGSLDSGLNCIDKGHGIFGLGPLTRTFDIKFALELWGYGKQSEDEKRGGWKTTFDAALNAKFSVSYGMSQPFTIGFIPAYWAFDLSGAVIARLSFGGQFHNKGEDLDWGHHFPLTKSGTMVPAFMVCLSLNAGLSVAFGVQGLLAFGIRGFGFFTLTAVFDKVEGKAYPHFTVHLGAGVEAFAQVLFFKKTVCLAQTPTDKGPNYDNWKTNLLEGAEDIDSFVLEDDNAPYTAVSDRDLGSCVEKVVTYQTNGGILQAGSQLEYAEIPPLSDGSFARVGFVNPFAESNGAFDPINGLRPTLQEALWKDVYSNPRIRIIHTDADSLKDRCFMLRLGVVAVRVPSSASTFATYVADRTEDNALSSRYLKYVHEDGSCALGQGRYALQGEEWVYDGTVEDEAEALPLLQSQSFEETDLAIEVDVNGNQFVLPAGQVSTPSNDAYVYRTRVIVCEWDRTKFKWGPGVPIDFVVDGEITAGDRLNVHDVDFDAEFYEGDLLVAITSVMRPQEGIESETPERYERNQYVSLVRWDVGDSLGAPMSAYSAGSTRLFNNNKRSLFYPRIVTQMFDGTGLNSGKLDIHCLVYSYMCLYNADGTRRDTQIVMTIFDDMSTAGFAGHRLSTPLNVTPAELGLSADELATGALEVVCPDRKIMGTDTVLGGISPSVAVLGWTRPGGQGAASFVLSETFAVKQDIDPDTGLVTLKRDIQRKSTINFDNAFNLAKLTRGGQAGIFSVVPNAGEKHEGKATSKMVTFDRNSLELSLIEDTGSTDKLRYFSSWNGRRLYTVRVMDSKSVGGTGPVLSDEVQQAMQKDDIRIAGTRSPYNDPSSKMSSLEDAQGPRLKLYQLLEARWVDSLQTYYDFYPLCQLDYIPDNIGVIAVGDTRTDFTFAQVEDKDKNQATIYQVAVPKCLVAEPGNVRPRSPFAAPGDKCWYSVDITNMGNAPITCLKMQVESTDFAWSQVDTFDDLRPYIQPSEENVQASQTDVALQSDDQVLIPSEMTTDKREETGILWPGKTRTFLFSFTVPDGKTGSEAGFTVSVIDCEDRMEEDPRFKEFQDAPVQNGTPLLACATYLYDQSNDAPLKFISPKKATIDSFESDLVAWSDQLGAANYKGVSSDGNSGSGDSKTAVATGDGFGMGLAGLGAAAAASAVVAGVAAYERRRAENEKSELQ